MEGEDEQNLAHYLEELSNGPNVQQGRSTQSAWAIFPSRYAFKLMLCLPCPGVAERFYTFYGG